MPLLRRELQELAQKKRTYGLRCFVWAVFLIVFLFAYAEVMSMRGSVRFALGQGREISQALFMTLILTIYFLNPVMACTAITSEKEKQTLGLLLISMLSPGEIVMQKIVSRMIPLLSLLLVCLPLFAVSYLFGGIAFTECIFGLIVMLMAVIQVTTVAVFCSALLESGVAAFWATYAILGIIYFTMPILNELDVLDIAGGTLPDREFMLFPVYQLAMIIGLGNDPWDVAPMLILSGVITLAIAVATRAAVVRFSYGSALSLSQRLEPVKQAARRLAESFTLQFKRRVSLLRSYLRAASDAPKAPVSDSASRHGEVSASLPQSSPVSWREMKRTIIGKRWLQVVVIAAVTVLTLLLMSVYRHDRADISAVMSLGGQVVATLLIMSFSCRLFAMERERQTLDSLLTTPLSNAEILRQKLRGINQLILVLLIPICILGCINLVGSQFSIYVPVNVSSAAAPAVQWRRQQVVVGSLLWIRESVPFLTTAVGCTFIYLHLAKWISVYWGLRMKTQMRAMMAAILAILSLCFLPLLSIVGALITLELRPDDFPLFFVSSPMIVPSVNEWHDMTRVIRDTPFGDSVWALIFLNFAVYGGLTIAVRFFVLRTVGRLLQRRDLDAVSPANALAKPVIEPSR